MQPISEERLMRQGRRADRKAQSFVGCLRKFLTPDVWKQAHQQKGCPKGKRWSIQPLLLTLLTMTWCAGDSQPERFETAKAFCIALRPKRARPGKTIHGFQRTLAKTPLRALRAVARGVRQKLVQVLGSILTLDGFIPLGCDGSRLLCPRVAELERRMGQAAQANSAPQVWITALVHLSTGMLWSWWIGKGDASERHHLQRLIPTLPKKALVVTDAGYQSFRLALSLLQGGVDFLVRASSQTTLYTCDSAVLEHWVEGVVYWWTHEAQRERLPALCLRLLRVRGRKHDVWLLTSVLQAERLPHALAARFYRMRWENEGFFRTYKRTLGKVKLQNRTVALVHREVESSLLAVQLLLAQGAFALAVLVNQTAMSSPRQVLLEIRYEIMTHLGPRQRGTYLARLAQATRERRQRLSAKAVRPWPGREPHKPPKAPTILKLEGDHKRLIHQHLRAG
jgi:hypothetical protein